MTDISGFPARKAAMRLLDAVLRDGETMDQAFGRATAQLNNFADKALARAIASEVLRWLTDLDALIDSAMKRNLPDDAKARSVLRLMLASWLRLETPPHAVIATALPLLDGGPRRLAHGVFSTLAKQDVTLPDVPTLPDAVRMRWDEKAEAIAAGLAVPPPLDLTLRAPDETDAWAQKLDAEVMATGSLRLPRGRSVTDLEGYDEGAWWAQDLAATLPARLLGAGLQNDQSRKVLDLCAAPGGKTLQLAAAGWDVTALDISKRRLEKVRENLDRTDLKATIVRADALKWRPKLDAGSSAVFDAILLDAPCTATGTLRRHPDVIHRIGMQQISELAGLQAALLARAADWLKPGAVLVYAVCSLERQEGEDQAAQFTASGMLDPMPITPEELPDVVPDEALQDGHVRTHPGMLLDKGGLDGFFIIRWRKSS